MHFAKNWRAAFTKKASWPGSITVITAITLSLSVVLGGLANADVRKIQNELQKHEHVPGELVVKMKTPGASSLVWIQKQLGAKFNVLSMRAMDSTKSQFVVKLSSDHQLADFIEKSKTVSGVVYAEPNWIYRIGKINKSNTALSEVIPNDTDFSKLWAMKNTGQRDTENADGVAGADIKATKAWGITTGNKNILVAVIDTGMDYTHPDLKDNVFTNPGESGNGKETNGIDDDANGFIDDVHGWNFAGVSTNNPMDDNSHGTHVSGTIGAKGNDGYGVAGVNWTASIMPVKFLTGQGSGTLEDAVKAINYATLMGAKVMNNSWGGGGFSQALFDAIKAAHDKGLLFIAAAGNDSADADVDSHYPAGYALDNVIAVAATTNTDGLASFSTFGKRSVHIAAPGNNIYSTVPGGKWDTFSGTSMATPHVAGAAALLWGTNESMSYSDVKSRLLQSRDYVPAVARKVSSQGRLNIYNAVLGIYPPSPEPAEDAWRDFTGFTTPVESEHPYKNDTKAEWTITGPEGAKYMRLVVSKFDMEKNYDTLKLIGSDGVEYDSMTGTGENVSTFFVPGNKVTVKFAADYSNAGWGFKIDKVQVVY